MSGYLRTGRGGAGNMITTQEALQRAQDANANSLARGEIATPPQGEYKHMGRGGAGNWFTPSELQENGTTSVGPEDADTTEMPAEEKRSVRQWTGRGGAGNFANAQENEKQKETEDIEMMERRVKEEVRREVDEGLKRPGSAALRGSARV